MKKNQIAIAAGLAVALLAVSFFATETGRVSCQLFRCHHLIELGKQGWGDEVSNIVSNMISRSSDKHALAERLLAQSDGSLVAEGLILLVQENHPDGKQLISKHLNDQRWNYNLEDNSTTASNCLLAYVSQNKQEKTKQDLRNIIMWRYQYVTRDLNELENLACCPGNGLAQNTGGTGSVPSVFSGRHGGRPSESRASELVGQQTRKHKTDSTLSTADVPTVEK